MTDTDTTTKPPAESATEARSARVLGGGAESARNVHRPVIVVTCLDDPTADQVVSELYRRGVPVVRLDTADFPAEVAMCATVGGVGADAGMGGWLGTPTRRVDLSDVRSVYWRRPTGYSFDRLAASDATFAEAESRHGLTGTLASLDCVYANHPFRTRAADYKPTQLVVAGEVGFAVPATMITNDLEEAREFTAKRAPAVYKPLRGAPYESGGEPRTIWVGEVEPASIDENVSAMVHMFQAKVRKDADVRVTVVGERVFAVRIDSGLLDWRADYDAHAYTVVNPPPGIDKALHAYLVRFGLSFGCFDFALDTAGEWVFLECNPNGQWAWLESVTGLPMTAAFADLLEETSR